MSVAVILKGIIMTKTLKVVGKWLKTRLAAPSTYIGIAAGTGVTVPQVDDPNLQIILAVTALVNAAFAGVAKMKKEQCNKDA